MTAMLEEVKVTFKDFEAVQTRLILLPLDEQQGLGAIVADYTVTGHDHGDDNDETDTAESETPTIAPEQTTPNPDGVNLSGFSLVGLEASESSESSSKLPADASQDNDAHAQETWNEKDFSTILGLLRQAEPPLVLLFEKSSDDRHESSDDESCFEEEKKSDADEETTSEISKSASGASPERDREGSGSDDENEPTPQPSLLTDRLSSWTTRMRASSVQLAAEASASAASISSAVATAAKERSKAQSRSVTDSISESQSAEKEEDYRLFLQSSSGAFLRVQPASSYSSASAASELRVTNSSLLNVRRSATQACLAQGCLFQWYRSANGTDWVILEGATYAAFQPSATDVGHRLRCVVTIEDDDDSENEESDGSEDESKDNKEPQRIVCEMPDTVSAALALFNGARQALVRGAQFGGLHGRGNAEGRTFLIKVEMVYPQNQDTNARKSVSSAVTIYQVSGSTAEPMHPIDEPIVGVSAACDYSHPKAFELTFPTGIPESASMVSALCMNGRFQLEAPNRLARESLLLTLGIANCTLKPADLNATTILYGSEDKLLQAAVVAPSDTSSAPEVAVADDSGAIEQLKSEYAVEVSSLESCVESQSDKIAELEKAVRTLTNEKALLSAAVEARESKLAKMAALQKSFDEVTVRVKEQDAIRLDLDEAGRRYEDVSAKLESVSKSESDCKVSLGQSQKESVDLMARLKAEERKTTACKREIEVQQMKIQKLIAERNSYKQKGDSLSKEIGLVCRNGRTIRDVEKILVDDVPRREEVKLLREQKRKALEDLQHCRTAYEQTRMAQKMAGMDFDSTKVLERNAQLEHLLSELTEYVNAKEMQLETFKQVNDALQTEIRDLAKANMSKNDI
jgi:hypothetical protein